MGPNYYHDIRVRLEVRLNYLEAMVEISDLAYQIDDESLRRLQERAKAELAALDRQ